MPQIQPEIDEAARRAWVDQITDAPAPADVLLKSLEELSGRQDIVTQAAIFEAVLPRVDVRHYWVLFRMAHVYAELGREDSAFIMAAQAVQMHPDWDASHSMFLIAFRYFARRGEARAALDLFLRQINYFPEKPIANRHEVEPLLRALGVDPRIGIAAAAAPVAAPRHTHRVADAEQRPPTPIRVVSGALPHGLAALSGVMSREEIDVVEFPGGELLVCNDAVAVRDAGGSVHDDVSVGEYAGLIAKRVLQPAAGEKVEQHEVDEAVLVLDAFAPPNLCHFLFDQVSRLELYRRAGADLAAALVVGPELRTHYQCAIAARAGMTNLLGTARVAHVRAKRLWVSTDCRALRHPAHYGAGWAIEHARAVLGGRQTSGSRRLYLSRTDSQTRQVQNEAELAAELARLGFETIVPGAMPYEAQLAAFRSASHVVAVHGAALSHIVVCPPQARVLELFHPLYGTWAYAMVAAACGLDYAALACRDGLSDAPELNDPDRVDLAAGRFGERNLRVDVAVVRSWVEQPD